MRLRAACIAGLLLCACGGGGSERVARQEAFALLDLEVEGRPVAILNSLGGDEVHLHGRGFTAETEVAFGGDAALLVTFVGPESITALAPPRAPGPVFVSVRGPDGAESILPDAVEYRDPPAILTVLAQNGPTAGTARASVDGGATVEVTGTSMRPGAEIEMGGHLMATVAAGESVRFEAPPHAVAETVALHVHNADGLVSVLPGHLEYTDEFSLAPAPDALDDAAARHLWRRAAFGATPADVQRTVADGLARTLDRLFTPGADDATDALAAALFTEFPPRANLATRPIQEWWLTHMHRGRHQLRERMAYFLHTHFVTGDAGFTEAQRYWLYEQIELFRAMALGNWRDLCSAVTRDRAMLRWLDGLVSTKTAPNENFARELWELFMLGADNGYTEADIAEASRAFTGYHQVIQPDLEYDTVNYDAGRHDDGVKTIFGVPGRFGYGGAVDARDLDGGIVELTLAVRSLDAARFLARRLAEFFLYRDPPASVVDELAADLVSDGWELAPVLRRLLASRAFFSARARKDLVKSPVDFAVGFLRATEIDMPPHRVRVFVERMGQSLLQPPDVGGWPGGEAWLSPQLLLHRANFVNALAASLVDAEDVAHLVPAAPTPQTIVAAVSDRLDVELSVFARDQAVSNFTYRWTPGGFKPFEFDPGDGALLATKTRGLLYLLAQHPEAHLE